MSNGEDDDEPEDDQAVSHLWPCGCLRNDGDAHRVGCPEYPEGKRGER